jgi:protein tyrosine/serine phosphatase
MDESTADLSSVVVPTTTDEERAFLDRTAALCAERNLPLERVKNARDLASARRSPVAPCRVYRTGRVSDATPADLRALFGDIGIKTLVDLRSPTELRDDPNLDRTEVVGDFTDMVFHERNRMVRELGRDEHRMTRRRKRDVVKRAVGGAVNGTKDVLLGFVDNFFGNEEGEGRGAEDDDDDADDECIDCIEAGRLIDEQRTRRNRKERHFVSIMDELKYVRGTLSKLRKRDIAKTILKSPTTIISKTARENIKKPFLDEINGGGLPMLNDLLLRFGAPGIKYVLDLCSDVNRHPVAFYCTAGKDRTGMIAAIILALLGADDADIVEDYSLSANVYAEMADHKAMVGALSQRSLDAKTFLGAPPHVMEDTLRNIRRDYGGVEEYLDFIGFGKDSRERLIRALTQ